MENRNELDLGLMTTEDMKSDRKVFEEQRYRKRSASAVAAGAGGAAGGAGGASGATAAKA